MAGRKWIVTLALLLVCGCGDQAAAPPAGAGPGTVSSSAPVPHEVEAPPAMVEPPLASKPVPAPAVTESEPPAESPVVQDLGLYESWTPEGEELQLIKVIRDRPWDAQPLLKYADWLEPQDPARAQLVRTQVELAKLDSEDPRRDELSGKASELESANRERWTERLGKMADSVSLRFGIIDSLELPEASDEQLAKLLQAAPEVRVLRLSNPALTLSGYQSLAKLPAVDEVTIEAEKLPTDALEALSQLPPWTVLHVYGDNEMREQLRRMNMVRMGRTKLFSPEEKLSAACRFLGTFDYREHLGEPTKIASLNQAGITDAEMQLLEGLPELEAFDVSESDITSQGIAHLAKFTGLKRLELWDTKVQSIAALSGLTSLERLAIFPEYDTHMGDAGLAAIENFTQLKDVYLNDEEITDETVKRFAKMTAMEKLELTVGTINDDHCLAALAGMSQLNSLTFQGGEISDAALEHLAGLGQLETLNLGVRRGTGAGFRHLGQLNQLRYLYLHGDGVTDLALEQLAPLVELKSIMAQGSAATEAGAKALAAKLKHVTIVLDQHVVKTPRETYTFTRKRFSDTVSILIPSDWMLAEASSDYLSAKEDGWERIGSYSGDQVGPSEIRMYLNQEQQTPREAIQANIKNNEHLEPKILQEDVQPLGNGEDSASCIYENTFGKHYLAAAKVDGGIVVLDCEAKSPRFAVFETMFKLIGESARIGQDPQLHADQTVELPADKVMPVGTK